MQDTIYLFDTEERHENFLPLSFTRPIADFRIGIETIREKWQRLCNATPAYYPVEYLREKFGTVADADKGCATYIAANIVPDERFAAKVMMLRKGEAITMGGETVAFKGALADFTGGNAEKIPYDAPLTIINYIFDIFLNNAKAVADDFRRITAGRQSMPLPPSNRLIGEERDDDGNPLLFIEEGANVEGATLNTKGGPIYIGKDAEIMEGACVRGPLALCAKAKIKMGAQIYGGSTFGPYCKVGGEVDNTVMFGYSNKAHCGYLGNAVIGEWCNIGAGVNASNLKNDYTKIRVWNYHSHSFMRTDLQFCGLIMGDHSKIGVNCMLNTATVLGVGVNIHGAGFPRVFVPSFSEGSPVTGFTSVSMKKFNDIAERVLSRRGLSLTEDDRRIYEKVYEVASQFK